MGYDVSYHPISESEMCEWYFDRLDEVRQKDFSNVVSLAHSHQIEEFYTSKYLSTLQIGANKLSNTDEYFDKTHGFFIAIIQGLFRTYYYLRGCMLTDLIQDNPEFARYTKTWNDILQTHLATKVANKIIENYCSGVFLPYEKVQQLYSDYANNTIVKGKMDIIFPGAHIEVLLSAMRYCIDNKLGLLEASEVITPNPFDLNSSETYSNLFNCDQQGPLIYRDTALAQINSIG